MLESFKILIAAILSAVFYGIVHDQVTARICIEYFTVFHPPVFATQSPTLLGLGWGIIATWWVGGFLGLLLVIAARIGSRPKLRVSALLNPIGRLLLAMAASALVSGLVGFFLARHGAIAPPRWVISQLAPIKWERFMADWWAHCASYSVGFFGGIALCISQYRKRSQLQIDAPRTSNAR